VDSKQHTAHNSQLTDHSSPFTTLNSQLANHVERGRTRIIRIWRI